MGNKPERFNKTKVKNYDENSYKEYLFEVDVEYPEHLHNFFLKEWILTNGKSLYAICRLKKSMSYT